MVDPRQLTVLAVDDNDAGRYVISRILQLEGFNVKEAATGTEALRLAATNPDLIILDVNLPDGNGLDICQQLKSNQATSLIPVLQMSAINISSDDRVNALEHGADGYICSPIAPRELVAMVKSLIRMRQAENDLQDKVEELHRAHEELEQRVEARTAELSRARAEAEMANRIKDEFLATVSHELRTPLTAILGWAKLLLTQKLEGAAVKRAVETIERNARAQAKLIEDILDISRIITGKLCIETQPVDLLPIIQTAIDSISPTAQAKNIQLKTKFDWYANQVLADPNRLQQVIYNLLSNAIKFTPNDGIIEIRLEQTASQVKITVSDNGKGISADFLPHVFDRFRQADGTITRRQGGLGLGLSIVRYLIELHNGTVEAHSEGENRGASFIVNLPLLGARTADDNSTVFSRSEADNTAISGEPTELKRFSGLKVLIVDDESDIREMVRVMLEQLGADVRDVSSGSAALEIISNWRPAVMIADIGMPEMDGYTLIKRVRARSAEEGGRLIAIALTAYARVEDRESALAAGFQEHLAKPLNSAELFTAILKLNSIRSDN